VLRHYIEEELHEISYFRNRENRRRGFTSFKRNQRHRIDRRFYQRRAALVKAQELAEVYAIAQASSDYESILANPEVDTVYVALPNHLHYDYAKEGFAWLASTSSVKSHLR
jgi:predicted dehydrogenase